MSQQYSMAAWAKYGGMEGALFKSQTVIASGNSEDDPLDILPFGLG